MGGHGGRGPWGGPRDWCMRLSDQRTSARNPRDMAGVPATTGSHGGRLVADAFKRQHMGTVVGHRGTGVPVGPRYTLIKGGLFHALPLRRL